MSKITREDGNGNLTVEAMLASMSVTLLTWVINREKANHKGSKKEEEIS